MVSGLVTSPCDQDMIFSGEARLMRMASKSLVSAPRSWKDGLIYLHLFQYRLRSRDVRFLLGLHALDVQAERLQLPDEDVERLGQPRGERRVALDDRLVDLRAPDHVVGLRGQQFLEDVRRSVGL